MAVCTYNGNAIIPGPLVEISREFQTNEDGAPVGTLFNITLKGRMVPHKGSPSSSGTWHTTSGYPADETVDEDEALKALLRKQEALRQLFATDGQLLEITPWDGSPPLNLNPRVKGLSFPDGLWFNVCEYEVRLEADVVRGLGTEGITDYYISRGAEDWRLEPEDERLGTYRLTHSVQAVGKRHFDTNGSLAKQAWERARDWALGRLGIDEARMQASGVLDATALQAFDYTRAEGVNKGAGSYSVDERWTLYDPGSGAKALDEYTVETSTSNDRVGEGEHRVSVNGTVTGFEVRDNTTRALASDRWANAQAKWAEIEGQVLARASGLSELELNARPLATRVSYNRPAGVITYAFDYGDKQTEGKNWDVRIEDDHATVVFASIPVPGRALGPIFQNMGTVTAKRRVISVEVQGEERTVGGGALTRPDYSQTVLDNYPSSYTELYVDSDREVWSPVTGAYSRTVGLTYI